MAIQPPPSGIDKPGQLMPRRNKSLINRITDLFVRAQPDMGPQPADTDSTQTGIVSEGLISLYDRQFKFDVTRRATYKDVEDMDQASEECSVALDTIADNVCTSEDGVQMSFQVVSREPQIQEILDQTVTTCKLHQRIRPMIRNLVKYGDMFGELIINGNAEVVNVKQLPPVTMFRNETMTGELLLGQPKYDSQGKKPTNGNEECAFEQKAESTGDIIATFWPWQIVHMRLNHDGFSPYGKSHLRVARVTYKKLKAIEESLIVGRLTRDILKLVFYVDTTGLSRTQRRVALSEFQKSITERFHVDGRRENPFSVMTDFFLSSGWIKLGGQVQPMQTKIDVIDPRNVGVHDITDIEYLHKKYLSTLRVPPAHLGFEKDVNAKSTLTIQDRQYVRWLRSIQQIVGQGLEQIFDIALLLQGVDPEQAEYEILWPSLPTTDDLTAAQAKLFDAQADQLYMQEGVIDTRWVQLHRLNLTDEEIEEMKTRIQQEQQEKMAQQQQQDGVEHDRAIELVKAKASATGFKASGKLTKNEGRGTFHDTGETDVPVTPTRSGVSQDLRIFGALLTERVENLLEEDISQRAEIYRARLNGHS